MAILGDFEVEVMVNGKAAREFNDDEEENNDPETVIKYCEAVSEARFEFRIKVCTTFRFTQGNDALGFYVTLDGKPSGGRIFNKSRFLLGRELLSNLDGFNVIVQGVERCIQYHFANLQTRDLEKTDDTTATKQKYAELGTMKVEIWRVLQLGAGHCRPGNISPNSLGVIPEKALKGRPLDVSAELKVAPIFRPASFVKVEKLNSKPIAIFIFKYRTIVGLKSLLILPRSPTPVSIEEKDIDDLSPEEMRELLRRQKAQSRIEAKKEEVLKRKRTASTAEHVQNTPAKPFKTSRTPKGQTVYHIESDDEEEPESARQSSPIDEELEIVTL